MIIIEGNIKTLLTTNMTSYLSVNGLWGSPCHLFAIRIGNMKYQSKYDCLSVCHQYAFELYCNSRGWNISPDAVRLKFIHQYGPYSFITDGHVFVIIYGTANLSFKNQSRSQIVNAVQYAYIRGNYSMTQLNSLIIPDDINVGYSPTSLKPILEQYYNDDEMDRIYSLTMDDIIEEGNLNQSDSDTLRRILSLPSFDYFNHDFVIKY